MEESTVRQLDDSVDSVLWRFRKPWHANVSPAMYAGSVVCPYLDVRDDALRIDILCHQLGQDSRDGPLRFRQTGAAVTVSQLERFISGGNGWKYR